MRFIYLLLLSACFQAASAQDYCSQVKKEVSPDKKIFDYASPFDPQEVAIMKVTRSINTDEDYLSDNFFVIFQVTGDLDGIYNKSAEGEHTEKEESKLVVEFDDKSKIIDDTIKVSHDFTNDKTQAIRYVYYTLTPQTIKDFSTKKVAKFSLAGYEQTVPSETAKAIMNYVECMRKMK